MSGPQAQLPRSQIAALGSTDRVAIRMRGCREVADRAFEKIASGRHVRARDDLGRLVRVVMDPWPGELFLDYGSAARSAGAQGGDSSSRSVFADGELPGERHRRDDGRHATRGLRR